MKVTLADIKAVYEIIKDSIVKTPVDYSSSCSKIAGKDIYFKLENYQ